MTSLAVPVTLAGTGSPAAKCPATRESRRAKVSRCERAAPRHALGVPVLRYRRSPDDVTWSPDEESLGDPLGLGVLEKGVPLTWSPDDVTWSPDEVSRESLGVPLGLGVLEKGVPLTWSPDDVTWSPDEVSREGLGVPLGLGVLEKEGVPLTWRPDDVRSNHLRSAGWM